MENSQPDRSAAPAAVLSLLYIMQIFCLSGCDNGNSLNFDNGRLPVPIKVNVIRPERVDGIEKTFSYFGTIEPNRRQTLGFAVGGKLVSMPGNQQAFSASAPIARLDQTQLISDRDQIQLRLQQLAADEGSDPEQTARLRQQLETIEKQIQDRILLAPFDCIVERQFHSENSLVGPNSPVLTIVETVNPKVQVDLPSRLAEQVSENVQYVFVLGKTRVSGKLRERAFTEVLPGNLTVTFDIESNLSGVDFSLGQAVEIPIVIPSNESGYWLPLTALQKNSNGLWSVFVVDRIDNRDTIGQQLVEVVYLRDDTVLVSGDLTGKAIVRDGLHRIVPGQRVEINETSSTRPAQGDSPDSGQRTDTDAALLHESIRSRYFHYPRQLVVVGPIDANPVKQRVSESG